MNRTIDLNLLRTFTAVAEFGGVSRAAQALGMPKSTVSRHITKLELDVGRALLRRDPDGLQLTAEGRRLFETARPAVLALADFMPCSTKQSVRIHAPSIYTQGVLSGALARCMDRMNGVAFEVCTSQRFASPDPREYDLVLFVGQVPDKNCEIWALPPVEARLFASPLLFGSIPPPCEIGDLINWPLLSSEAGDDPPRHLRLITANQAILAQFACARLTSQDMTVLTHAALSGAGIARLPSFIGDGFVRSGELIQVMPEFVADRHSVTIARSFRNSNPDAKAAAELLVELISESLDNRAEAAGFEPIQLSLR